MNPNFNNENRIPQNQPLGSNNVQQSNEKKPGKALGIISLIFGILSIDLFNTYFLGLPLGITAVILAIVDKKKNKKFGDLSIPGLVLGIVGTTLTIGQILLVVAYIAFYVFYFLFIISMFSSMGGYSL